ERRSRKRQSKIEGCSTKPLPPKLKQKLNQSLHYQTASALRKTLTTDTSWLGSRTCAVGLLEDRLMVF
ncbi:MAG: hypothetical protein AAFX90_20620, partial [Pseudomonadota bacterium]